MMPLFEIVLTCTQFRPKVGINEHYLEGDSCENGNGYHFHSENVKFTLKMSYLCFLVLAN